MSAKTALTRLARPARPAEPTPPKPISVRVPAGAGHRAPCDLHPFCCFDCPHNECCVCPEADAGTAQLGDRGDGA
jgi:hypothetical protein